MEQFVLDLAPPPAPTFDNFVVGRNSALLSALRAFVHGKFEQTVVALWGATGAGRTHLLRAALAECAGPKLYITGDQDPPMIPQRALVALDDVQQLDAARQQAWFEAFQLLRERGGRLLISADRSIATLALRDDLRTRLGSGVVFEVQPLTEHETRAAMHAHALARRMPVPEPEELFDYLLTRSQRDLGTQITLLDALDRYALATKRALTVPLARTVLQQSDPQAKP